ncbi:hypothetical protein MMC07_001985 [Pseudocyphellaria aurata]|nr:hypothetical protein [Pseudocyphellaria aurata]
MRALRICAENAVRFTVLNEAMNETNTAYVTVNDKARGNGIHIDIFIGSNKANGGKYVKRCEDALTPLAKQTIIRGGEGDFPVNTGALFQVSKVDPTKGTCHPEHTSPGNERELCRTAQLPQQSLDTEYGNSYTTANVGDGDNVINQGNTPTPNLNFGNWPAVVADTGPINWNSFNFVNQNTQSPTTEPTTQGQTAEITSEISYLADASQVSDPFLNLDTHLSSVGNQNTNSYTIPPATSNQDTVPPSTNLFLNPAAFGGSTDYGDIIG